MDNSSDPLARDSTLRAVQTSPIALAELTTIGLGGPAATVVTATSAGDVAEAVRAADDDGGALVLGGGSNLIVADRGVDVPVVRVGIEGLRLESPWDDAPLADYAPEAVAVLGAGVDWDDAVAELVADGWAGLEALSGIPGSVGAAPVQNIGAYGVEIADRLIDVQLYRRDIDVLEYAAPVDLRMAYRHTVLKNADLGVVTEVRLGLTRTPQPVRYPEVARLLGVRVGDAVPPAAVRAAVLDLRRGKGMVLDPADADTRSVGSFFTNPVVPPEQAAEVRAVAASRLGADVRMPEYPADGGTKLSAAWLVERAGFPKGYPLGIRPDARIALSTKHTLALTNRGGGTTAELLALAREVRDGVRAAFGVTLVPEAVLVGCSL